MNRPTLICWLAFFWSCGVFGQESARDAVRAPAFEVASIKEDVQTPAPSGLVTLPRLTGVHVEPGAVTLRHVSLADLICWAFRLIPVQVSGPAWLDSQRFEVIAKAAENAPEADLRIMTQTLLSGRFKMKFHRETKTLLAYKLVPAKSGLKCQLSREAGDTVLTPALSGTATIRRATFAQIADFFSGLLHEPIFDETGFEGRYDCVMDARRYQPEPGQQPDMTGLLITVIQEQLGVRVEVAKMPVEILVIDHIEKTPTQN
jgi:uncharacterized protein (TIGR03435 family)